NVNLTLKGGVEDTGQRVMEYDGNYPEGSKFGNTPAWGFYIRHTDEVQFINCRFEPELPDARECLVTDNVGDIDVIN
ncbi:MAG TPA: hypothetical protein VJ909_09340, partial [Prolixibacteraceae bacterium]|nr:hypothetical protein [Prolixibacteraceae bacterium]